MSRQVVEDDFARYGHAFDRACKRAIVHGAQATKEAARQTVPKGETGKLERSIHIVGPEETLERITVWVIAGQFYGKFLEFGTLGKRKRGLQRERSAASQARAASGGGIRPRYFMLKAGRIGAPAFARALADEIRRLHQ